MSLIDKAFLVIFRYAEKGLEVFFVKTEDEQIQSKLVEISEKLIEELPLRFGSKDNFIQLDPIEVEEDKKINAVAIEGDWHDLPSLRALLKDDFIFVKDKVKKYIPTFDTGHFVSFTDAIKNVVKTDYKVLKELKEILTDRNSVKNL